MAIGFVIDTTRPTYGRWVFGWLTTGAIQQAYQAWITQFGSIPGQTEAEPIPGVFKPTGFAMEGGYTLSSGSVFEDVYGIQANADGAIRYNFGDLPEGSYTLSFNVTGLTDDSPALLVSLNGNPEISLDSADPTVEIPITIPAGGVAGYYVRVHMPDTRTGSFFIHDVTIARV